MARITAQQGFVAKQRPDIGNFKDLASGGICLGCSLHWARQSQCLQARQMTLAQQMVRILGKCVLPHIGAFLHLTRQLRQRIAVLIQPLLQGQSSAICTSLQTLHHLGLLMSVKPPATHAATTYPNGKR